MHKSLSLLAAAIVLISVAACQKRGSGPTDEERGIEATASAPLKTEPTATDQSFPMLKQSRRVDTGGDCAPRYKHGGFGSCVNNVPCRGFGVVDDKGQVTCSCYGDAGGCAAEQRCDEKKLTCVADENPPFNRSP